MRMMTAERKSLLPPKPLKEPKPRKVIDYEARGIKIGNALRGRKHSEESKKKMHLDKMRKAIGHTDINKLQKEQLNYFLIDNRKLMIQSQ